MLIYSPSFVLFPLLVLAAMGQAQARAADRPPAVAGMFYPDREEELRQTVADLFATAVGRQEFGELAAIIVPHAGYVYSGQVAASGFNQIDPQAEYDNIFILGPSHRVGFEGAAVFTAGNFRTPLGTVPVNQELGEVLCRANRLFTSRTDAHAQEHSVEVQVPFLQQHLKKPFRIVPIVLGSNRPEVCRQIGDTLRPYLNGKNLFVISTDFSHYPAYDDAVRVDRAVAEAIVTNSAATLLKTLRTYEQEADIDNLATALCGVSGVLSLLAMTEATPGISYHPIQYQNSGDASFGDRHRVVGYHAIAASRPAAEKSADFTLSAQEKKTLLALARATVERYVTSHTLAEVEATSLTPTLKTPCGAFVTLKKQGQLRGCIGRFDAQEPLYRVVQEMAVAAATQDYRFPPVTPAEVAGLTVEISVLTPMRKIASSAEFQLGKHGIYIRKGLLSGTFLPQVAHDTGWSKEEFLGHCARDKAGLGWEGWRDAELFVYEALVFGEE